MVADPTSASVTASDISWLVTSVTLSNKDALPPQPLAHALGGAKSGSTPYGTSLGARLPGVLE